MFSGSGPLVWPFTFREQKSRPKGKPTTYRRSTADVGRAWVCGLDSVNGGARRGLDRLIKEGAGRLE